VGDLSRARRHGSHTTTRSEIFLLKNDTQSAIADTPGFDWLTLLPNSPSVIAAGFPEFGKVGSCRFQDCRHLQEPNCAVREALRAGTIWESRHKSYTMLMKELESKPKAWEQKND
jgi:ribosome biogenesis GTPase